MLMKLKTIELTLILSVGNRVFVLTRNIDNSFVVPEAVAS